jgi:pimeloyl-ACP methyl ester carboxylesterase
MPRLYDSPEVCRTYFFPQPGDPLPSSADAGPIPLQLHSGTRIGGYWSRPLEGAPTLLYLHGNGECISDALGHWPGWAAAGGYNLFLLDYPGYASSDGVPGFSSCREAAEAALSFLLERSQLEVPWVAVMGRSLGSLFALDLAASHASAPRLGALILESAVADLKQRLALRLPYDRLGLDRARLEREIDDDWDAARKLARICCPVLVLHSKTDGLIPVDHAALLARWAGERLDELLLLDEGDHNSIQLRNAVEYQEAVAAFLRRARP